MESKTMYNQFIERAGQKRVHESFHWLIKALKSETITEKQFEAISVGFIAHFIKEETDKILNESLKPSIKHLIVGASKKHHAGY